jgi:hypothetical protein
VTLIDTTSRLSSGARFSRCFLESRQEPSGDTQGPSADRNDQSRLLGKRYECPGRHKPRARVLPTQKGLEADQVLIGEGDERLEVEPQLSVVECLPQLILQLKLGDGIP